MLIDRVLFTAGLVRESAVPSRFGQMITTNVQSSLSRRMQKREQTPNRNFQKRRSRLRKPQKTKKLPIIIRSRRRAKIKRRNLMTRRKRDQVTPGINRLLGQLKRKLKLRIRKRKRRSQLRQRVKKKRVKRRKKLRKLLKTRKKKRKQKKRLKINQRKKLKRKTKVKRIRKRKRARRRRLPKRRRLRKVKMTRRRRKLKKLRRPKPSISILNQFRPHKANHHLE